MNQSRNDIEVRTILVPLDGSEFSVRAVPVGVRLADRLGAGLVLFSAVPKEEDRRERVAWLSAVAPRGREARSWVVVNADPAGAIHETLKQLDAAIACMASHGRNRSAALVGSVATEVIARGHDALVLVGPMIDVDVDGKGVVACIDETPASQALLPVAARFADLLGESLDVITVAEPVLPSLTVGPPKRRFGPDEDVDMYLEATVAPLRAAGRAVETHAVYDPVSPAAGIRDYVWQHPASLVAVASHARRGAKRFLLGSVAAEVVHSIVSPVLVVPRPDAK
jgi:nucleotide-binding universal stress UspA family protein